MSLASITRGIDSGVRWLGVNCMKLMFKAIILPCLPWDYLHTQARVASQCTGSHTHTLSVEEMRISADEKKAMS